MKNFLTPSFFFLLLIANAQINFRELSWQQALKESGSSGKPVFLNAYTNWCEPCQVMDEFVFTDLEVSNFFNDHFVNIRLDMEEYPGMELAETHNVIVYPGFLFFNAKEEVIHRGCGGMDAGEFLSLAKRVFEKSHFKSYRDQFREGDRTIDFIFSYLDVLDEACLDAQKAAQRILDDIPEDQLFSEPSFRLLENYQWDVFSREFQFLIGNSKQFEDSLGSERVRAKIYHTFLSQYQEIYVSEELHLFALKALMREVEKANFAGSDTLLSMMKLHYFELTDDWINYSEEAVNRIVMLKIRDMEELSDLAWKFYLFIEDKKKLSLALEWAKLVVDNTPEPSAIDTYASILYKLGDTKKAIQLEENAIELAISSGEDITHYKYQLSKFSDKRN